MDEHGLQKQIPILSVVRLTSRAALTLPESQLSAEVARAKGARWLVAAGAELPQTLAAVALLWRVGLAPDQLILQGRFVAVPDLRKLWRAGVRQVAWSVQAVAAGHASFELLSQAVHAAKKIGFFVQLRWSVALESAPDLAELASVAVAALGCDEIVLQPDLRPGHTPSGLLLRQFWPQHRPVTPRLVLSQLWPRCMGLSCDALEPVPDAPAAEVVQRPGCRGCPAAHQCPGIAQAVLAACDASAAPWRGMAQEDCADGGDASTYEAEGSPASAVRFSGESIEMSGLRQGLRDAWRLRVAGSDLAAFVAAVRSDGWQVAWTEQLFVGHAGGKMTQAAAAGADAAHVVVVARTEALAKRCVADELELLRPDNQRSAPPVGAMMAAHLRLGAAYGFPECCVEAFCDAFGEVVYTDRLGDNAVAVLRAALRSEHFDSQCFTLVAGLGQPSLSPLRHLPCRFDCPASRALATRLQPQAPPPWPVVVWSDGSFAVVHGRWAGAGLVTGVQTCQVYGFDPADAQCSADRRAFAQPLTWSEVEVRAGELRFGPGPGWVSVPESPLPSSEMFPLLLPFTESQ